MFRKTPATYYNWGLLKGGDAIFALIGSQKVHIKGDDFSAEDKNTDTRSYFSDRLRVVHQGPTIKQQFVGAALPAIPNTGQPALDYQPAQRLSWTQVDVRSLKLRHLNQQRVPEKSIFKETANNSIERGGVAPRYHAAWTHSSPDHINFLSRLDKELRVPGYKGANQVHTAFESAAEIFSRTIGTIKVTRVLGNPVPRSKGLITDLQLGFALDGKDDTLHHFFHHQPYFASDGARHGDDVAIVKFLAEQRQRIDKGLPTLADKITKNGKSGHGNDVDEFAGKYPSVAANHRQYVLNHQALQAEPSGDTHQPRSRRDGGGRGD